MIGKDLGEKVEECLEALFRLEKNNERVKTTELAEKLGFPLSSMTVLLQRLANMGLVEYEPYKGVRLTDKGRKVAIKIIRRHRLSERFLTDILGLDWCEVHEQACKLEHAITNKIEEKLDKKLGSPAVCPHGNPIPTPNGEIIFEKDIPLSELQPAEEAVITRIIDEDPTLLRRLIAIGILPGVKITVKEKSPLGGALVLKIGDYEVALGRDVASKICVKISTAPHRHRHRMRRGAKSRK
ncbi:MAG: metal-dependent transcriptional regulator [Candidatus Baldrarchaeia archaeon]